jgi:hypothetical protein
MRLPGSSAVERQSLELDVDGANPSPAANMREATARCVAAVCKTAPDGQTTQVQLLPRMPSLPENPSRGASFFV